MRAASHCHLSKGHCGVLEGEDQTVLYLMMIDTQLCVELDVKKGKFLLYFNYASKKKIIENANSLYCPGAVVFKLYSGDISEFT